MQRINYEELQEKFKIKVTDECGMKIVKGGDLKAVMDYLIEKGYKYDGNLSVEDEQIMVCDEGFDEPGFMTSFKEQCSGVAGSILPLMFLTMGGE